LDADEKNLSVEEKKKKKKLIDGMKRKVKGRNTEDEDELEVLGVKSRASFKMEAECLIFFINSFSVGLDVGYGRFFIDTK
jgi:acyl CoA:acetate/3-ketoacid CoA transferase